MAEKKPYYIAIKHMHEIMDGTEWNADTLDAIAAVLMGLGLRIREPEVPDHDNDTESSRLD